MKMMKNAPLQYVWTNGRNPDFCALCGALDAFLNTLAGGEENRAAYVPCNQVADVHDVLIVYVGHLPVGCAALRPYDAGRTEVKRVFVSPAYRGRGIGKALMERLEQRAKILGYTALILESGEPLAAAMALYRSLGYRVIPNYGPYRNMPDSVCMEKKL